MTFQIERTNQSDFEMGAIEEEEGAGRITVEAGQITAEEVGQVNATFKKMVTVVKMVNTILRLSREGEGEDLVRETAAGSENIFVDIVQGWSE